MTRSCGNLRHSCGRRSGAVRSGDRGCGQRAWSSCAAASTTIDRRPAGPLDIRFISTDRCIDELLVRGEIDAYLGARRPKSFGEDLGVRRLFADPRAEERAWFQRTGIFPMMHTLPWLHADLDEVDEFGGDPWPYGLEPNRTALEALLGFLVQQGFLDAASPVEDLFARLVTSNE